MRHERRHPAQPVGAHRDTRRRRAAARAARRGGDVVTGYAVDLATQPTTLTRADKERAVREMSWRLMSATCEYDRHCWMPGAEDYARTLRRRHDALVRLAMARTVEDGTR